MTWGGDDWNRSKVEARLVAALKSLPGRGAFSCGSGRYEFLDGSPVGDLALIEFAEAVLPRDDYRLLITWAACRTRGGSFAEWCRDAGLGEDACRKRRERAAMRLAKLLQVGNPNHALTVSASAEEADVIV